MIRENNLQVILGLDPGYDRLGWAVGTLKGQQWQHLEYGLIQTDATRSIHERYQQLATQLTGIIAAYSPQVAAIESLFFAKNRKTALQVSEARGIIVHTCLTHQLEIIELTPQQIKLAVTGYGRADKKSVEKMVRLQLKLGARKVKDDTIDALAVMLAGSAPHLLKNQVAMA